MVKHRFSIRDYHKAHRAGALGEGRVELLEGEVYQMSPMGYRHRFFVTALTETLVKTLSERAVVMPQCSLIIAPDSEPEPDLMLLKPPLTIYKNRDPFPEDVLLLIEVSDTTLAQDRSLKVPLYATASIPEIWILNIVEERLEVYRTPDYQPLYIEKGVKVAPMAFEGDALEWWE
jgi:Uma2 family endonuclease